MPVPTRNLPASRVLIGLALALALCGGACGADNDAGGVVDRDATGPSDTSVADVGPIADTSVADTTPTPSDTTAPSDATPADTRGDTDAAPTTTKDDPDFIVPAGVAARAHAAAAGSRVAWVERDDAGAPPRLVVWDLATPDLAPRAFTVPNLLAPRELALGDNHLVYVDDRYGDPDVFAVDLETGADIPVVTEPGAQDAPTIARAVVAWADCRRCVSGDGGLGRDIYRAELPNPVEVPVTFDAVPDRAPTFGTLEGGDLGLAWVHDEDTLRVTAEGGGLDVAWAQLAPIASVALTDGVLAWRPQPVIINPDSMIPSDLFLTSAATGDTAAATLHAEAAPVLPIGPRAALGRVAWLESPPDDAGVTLIRVVSALDQAVVVDVAAPAVARSLALGGGHVVITAPRSDNGGLDDVWALPLP